MTDLLLLCTIPVLFLILVLGAVLVDSWQATATTYRQRAPMLKPVHALTAELITLHNGSSVFVLTYTAHSASLVGGPYKGASKMC